MKPLDIVKVEGSERERVVIKSFVDLDGYGGYRVYNKCAELEDFKKYGIGALTTTFSDSYLIKT